LFYEILLLLEPYVTPIHLGLQHTHKQGRSGVIILFMAIVTHGREDDVLKFLQIFIEILVTVS
jgi:hypothetical protein